MFFELFVNDEDYGIRWDQSDQIWLESRIESRDTILFPDVSDDVGHVRLLLFSPEVEHHCPHYYDRIGQS